MRRTVNSPLRNMRRARTISQEDLARLVGLSQETISRIEHGTLRPTVDIQARLAAILGASVRELFSAEPEQVIP